MDSDALSDSSSSQDDSCESGDDNENGDLYETCCFNKRILQIPQCFCSEEDVFSEVLGSNTWKSVLNSKHSDRLIKFLPTFSNEDDKEKNETLRKLIQGENFKFGNPLKQFFQRLKDGFLSSEIVEVSSALKQANFREYKNQQKQYSFNLFKDILVTRKKLIDASYILPPDQSVKMQQFIAKPKDATLLERTRLRYFSALQDLRDEVGEMETSSEDENYPENMLPKVSKKLKRQFQSHETPLSPELTRISSTMFFPSGCPGAGNFLNSSPDMFEVSEERYREMLQSHKKKLLLQPSHPVLNISQIDMKAVSARCNLTKRTTKSIENVKKKIKIEPSEKPNLAGGPEPSEMDSKILFGNLVIKEEPISSNEPQFTMSAPCLQETEVQTDPLSIPEESEESHVFETQQIQKILSPPQAELHSHPSCFFSLIRDIFCESPEQKLSASKLEEKVKAWQGSPMAAVFEWPHAQELWVDSVSSALKFLAGDLITILPETFVPFLDYKEKQQQWQWIGSGRDSDEQMYDLCQQWLETKNDVSSDILETSQASPPPPRVTTGWTVRTTAEEEKIVYREQECIRYQNPHKAFTFKVHGYEAVVGPVKGVYGKESGINKAREHSLLTSDRPPFVTILSLVRDSAARLPNGEGTRADICELLKDSQYLALASDQQIHTVVSGALDRLHYEKDPCVKYDVNRKLWIYLHRHRTEEEFERIHQAQAAAAKARKAVQKNKIPKFKNKEVTRSISCAQHVITNTDSVAVLNMDLPPSISTALNSQAGRTQTSQSTLTPGRFVMHTLPTPSQAEIKCAVLNIEAKNKTFEMIKSEIGGSIASTSIIPTTEVIPPSKPPPPDKVTSRQTSMAPTLTLSSPKSIIGNINATQIVSVTPVQLKACASDHPTSSPQIHDVMNVDMKPSSPSFVGQPPVLQPILSHQGLDKTLITTLPAVISTNTATVSKAKINCATLPGLPAAALAGFQTIVIKQDPNLRACNGVSTIPLLSIEERLPTSSASGVTTGPVVARLVHGSQYLSFGNLVAASTACSTNKPIGAAVKNFRVQGGNICQQVLSASTIKVMHSGPVSAIGDSRLPVIAIKNPSGNLKEHAVITTPTATLNLGERLYQMTSVRNAIIPKEGDTQAVEVPLLKEAPKGFEKNAASSSLTPVSTVYTTPITLTRNPQTVIKLSPK